MLHQPPANERPAKTRSHAATGTTLRVANTCLSRTGPASKATNSPRRTRRYRRVLGDIDIDLLYSDYLGEEILAYCDDIDDAAFAGAIRLADEIGAKYENRQKY